MHSVRTMILHLLVHLACQALFVIHLHSHSQARGDILANSHCRQMSLGNDSDHLQPVHAPAAQCSDFEIWKVAPNHMLSPSEERGLPSIAPFKGSWAPRCLTYEIALHQLHFTLQYRTTNRPHTSACIDSHCLDRCSDGTRHA